MRVSAHAVTVTARSRPPQGPLHGTSGSTYCACNGAVAGTLSRTAARPDRQPQRRLGPDATAARRLLRPRAALRAQGPVTGPERTGRGRRPRPAATPPRSDSAPQRGGAGRSGPLTCSRIAAHCSGRRGQAGRDAAERGIGRA